MISPRRVNDPPALPVLAVSILERQCAYQGELFPLAQLPDRLAERASNWRRAHPQIPPAIVATDDPGALIAGLDRRFSRRGEPGRELWQWQLSLRPGSLWLGANPTAYEALAPHLAMFGWSRRRGGKHRKRSRFYRVLDVMAWTEAEAILNEYPGVLAEQLARFALDVQRFCLEQRMTIRLTPAGIAGQLLRDPRFWGDRRRKLPKATNRSARRALPGNYYQLTVPVPASDRERPLTIKGEVLELDLERAHHTAAMRIQPPASGSLYAWGAYYAPPRERSEWQQQRMTDTQIERVLAREHGLLMAAVEVVPGVRLDPYAHPAMRHSGTRWRYVWTPEIPLIESRPGVAIVDIAAGWTSPDVDHGLCEYAWFAGRQLEQSPPARRRWLKQTLLAGYGLLAARPRGYHNLWRWTRGRDMAVMLPSGYPMRGRVRSTKAAEPSTANVIWRGMIEAWVRAETIAYAWQLRDAGWRVLSLYADAIYVLAQGQEPPPVRGGWRVSNRLHAVQFYDPTHFTSDEIDKLPGIPRAARAA